MAEKCSGSGDCKKSELTGGTMCPSFMATRKEKDSTRARANILRQYLTNSPQNPQKEFIPNQPPISAEVVKEVLDLCLSCKGCKTECPSSVDGIQFGHCSVGVKSHENNAQIEFHNRHQMA
mgnify:CR=1 FL=1